MNEYWNRAYGVPLQYTAVWGCMKNKAKVEFDVHQWKEVGKWYEDAAHFQNTCSKAWGSDEWDRMLNKKKVHRPALFLNVIHVFKICKYMNRRSYMFSKSVYNTSK